LSAIVAADVAGYSRLMHNDEEVTHAKLRALLAETVEPAIAEHGGRIVKNTGDGFLAEFPSAVEAVRAAVQFQTRIETLEMRGIVAATRKTCSHSLSEFRFRMYWDYFQARWHLCRVTHGKARETLMTYRQ